ncbi:penicillin-binding protein [Pseudonocardia sp. DSM 110487]|uniref:transglycosylase domain-containing protein n=1 Tax=Pseudonocardia sp. DSM 110487 TaxID=2865833 RepID=UPI001C69CE16|nr:transglycosylase domain-containing protein [Pseudonocardia sp. DSM 110487]QYN35777.1 penicillin-binding protein [Pseudonocardia sp. DSM 110487]
MSDQRDPRFDAPRGRPRQPYGGPPPRHGGPGGPGGPQRRQAPPPDSRGTPQRYRADGPPVASGRRTPDTNSAVPLLTHDDGDPTAVVSGHGARTAVAERPRRPSAAGRGRKKVSPWRRVRRISYVVLGLLLIGPFVAFVVGWFMFPVPSSQDVALAQVATFKFARGEDLATVRPENENRVAVTLDKVPKHVRDAVLSAEDRSFYSNPGFDFVGIARAVYNQLTGGVGGGSTITQQYIKVSTGEDDFSAWRKYKEVVLAVKISREKTKDEILENYLNTIYLGRGAYGIQAAAKAYFNKDVGQLTVSEGAMLAGVIQSPSRWDPAKNPERSQERWNFVLDGMVEQGWLDRGERAAQTFPQLPEIPDQTGGGIPDDDRYHIYERALKELEAKGITSDVINTRGVTVTTTVQQPLQAEAVDTVKKQMARQPDNLRSGLVSIDPKTGAIISYYGGTEGLALDYAGEAFRQPGSSFKPFVLAAALENEPNFGLGTQLDGSGPRAFPGRAGVVRNVEGVSCTLCGAEYAMTESINTWFYELGIQTGIDNVVKAAHQAGIPDDLLQNANGGVSLGDKEVHPIDMASAYATFAAEGIYHEPYIVSRVEAADGEVLYERSGDDGRQVMSQQVARNVIEAMLGVAPKKGYALPNQQVAAKTGTAQLEGSARDNRDAWFVGFTPNKATAVWVGTDKSEPIRDAQKQPIFGSGLPGKIWHEFMKTATEDDPTEPFSTFLPMGTPPTSDVSDESSSPDDEDEDENSDSDSDEDRDSDSNRSSDDDNGSSSDNNSRSGRSGGDDDSGSGSGSNDQPTSAGTQDSGTSGTGTSGSSSNRGQSNRSALNETSDSGPVG